MHAARNDLPRLALRKIVAPAIEVGPVTVRPVAKSIVLTCGRGALVRSWPSALLVSKDERRSRIRIVDVTRRAQALVIGAAMLCLFGLVIEATKRKERSS